MITRFKNNIKFLSAVALIGMVSCVDDYTDANPKPRLDAPNFRVSATGSNQKIVETPVNRFQTTSTAYVEYGGPVEFTVSVIDAPGKVAAVSVTPSVPDFGTVTLNDASVSALTGKEQGEFKFTFTPSATLPDEADRPLNLVITVSDGQQDEEGEANPKVTSLTLPVNIVSCVSEGIVAGTYTVTSASGNLDGGAAYTLDDIEADAGGDISIVITKDFPGRYTINEVTGGIWPTYYGGRARPTLKVDLCGSSIVGHPGAVSAGAAPGPVRTFDISGTLNGDGSITITWSYFRANGPTPANPAKGTFTMARN